MSGQPRDLTLERIARLGQAITDLMESQTAQGRNLTRIVTGMGEQLDRIEARLNVLASDVRNLASEQVLLGNRVENAFSRAMRVNIRLDEIEDAP